VSGQSRKRAGHDGRRAYDSAVLRVAYFGPAGTFTEEALLTQADLAAGRRTPHGSVPEVIAAVERGDVDGGVVPIENMIEGSVSVTLDTLAFDSELLIQREIDLPVSLNLCAPPGVTLADVRTVTSFPHAIAQCRGWLGKKLAEADTRASHSTSDAAREVSRSKRRDLAAICNALAAELYGLEVLATDIEDHPENETRFVLVGRGVPAPTGHDKTSIVCFQRQDRPGSLLGILQEFAARDVNLTKLESRPTKQGLGDYCFFIDCEGHVSDEVVADALRNVRAKQGDVKFLGSYPVGGPREAGVEKRRRVGKAWKQASDWVDELRAQIRDRDA
jgi:prephenate dehydratase